MENLGMHHLSLAEAMAQIEAIRYRVMVMGRNDSEKERIDRIEKQLSDGKYSPERALEEAIKLFETKQDYN
jgi:ADP-heptose:LPS heptosyltransferase